MFCCPSFGMKISEVQNAKVSCSRACIQLGKGDADITSHQHDFRIQTPSQHMLQTKGHQLCRVKKMSHSAGVLESHSTHSYTKSFSSQHPKEQSIPKTLKNCYLN